MVTHYICTGFCSVFDLITVTSCAFLYMSSSYVISNYVRIFIKGTELVCNGDYIGCQYQYITVFYTSLTSCGSNAGELRVRDRGAAGTDWRAGGAG